MIRPCRRRAVLPALLAAALVAACSPVGLAVGAGATVATAASEERGLGGAVDDVAIQAEINRLWLEHDFAMYRRVDLAVREGRVLLTGAAPTPQARLDAIRLAWQADGVRAVIDEMEVDDTSTLVDEAADDVIARKLQTRLLLDRRIRSINYTVEVVNGTAYLFGVAQDRETLERAVSYARDMRGVRQVVTHVRVKGEAIPNQTPLPDPAQ
ncbi:BON domain-containing protein [uncultured Rhodospira sp.]|uniref:BON domain-containing protein n=1 Tax=uncultured Rhodospira sp. TaxID=1936189 RepID=UPI002633D7F0|nr:BON domain-containing protein [uncultured Rhodospira sp.]